MNLIEKVNVEKFRCPLCETLYDKEEDVLSCIENNEWIEKYKNILQYTWVHLKSKPRYIKKYDIWEFICNGIPHHKYCCIDKSCLNKYIELFDYNYKNRYSTNSWDIIETLTIEEYYEKTGKYPMIDERYPEYINNRIRTIVEKEQNKILDRFNSMSKDELIGEITKQYDVFNIK